jgi:hypothetical protein
MQAQMQMLLWMWLRGVVSAFLSSLAAEAEAEAEAEAGITNLEHDWQ